jgi:hypothetical protein
MTELADFRVWLQQRFDAAQADFERSALDPDLSTETLARVEVLAAVLKLLDEFETLQQGSPERR